MRDTFWFICCGARERLVKLGGFGVGGAGVAFLSDVMGSHPHRATNTAIAFLALAGVSILAILILSLKQGRLTTQRAVRPHHVTRTEPVVPDHLKFCRDLALFGFISAAQLFGTGIGQTLVGTPASGPDKGAVSLFATLIPELNGLRGDVQVVSEKLDRVDQKLGNVKRETSEDPRKELANQGTSWSSESFLDAVKTGDLRAVRLFVAGGMPASATSQGRPLPVMLALNVTNPEAVLDVLANGALDINQSYEVSGGLTSVRMTLLSRAIERGNVRLVKGLLGHHVNVNAPVQTFGAMGVARDTYPLASAVSWRKMDVAEALLDNGADPALGDFAAYREAQTALEREHGDEARNRLQALMARLAPSGNTATRVGDEMRLQHVESELNTVALEGLRTMRGSSKKVELDRRYDELQVERTALQRRLGIAGQPRQ